MFMSMYGALLQTRRSLFECLAVNRFSKLELLQTVNGDEIIEAAENKEKEPANFTSTINDLLYYRSLNYRLRMEKF